MTYRELSDAFDVYSNRFAAGKDTSLIPFDEYEKSLFLTKAADEIVKELLPFYDRNEKIKKQLLPITRTTQLNLDTVVPASARMKSGSLVYELPTGVVYVAAESLKNTLGAILRKIKPLKDDEAFYSLESPFRSPTRGYAFRGSLSYVDSGVTKKYSEIITDISATADPKYYIKYIIDVPAIIVADDLDDASIKGVAINPNIYSEAPLTLLHEKILDRAIIMAYTAKTDDTNAKVANANLSSNS